MGRSPVPQTAVRTGIDLAAEDGPYAVFAAYLLKFGRGAEIAVIRNGAGLHAEGDGAFTESRQAYGAVEHAVFGMAVQVDKFGHGRFRSGFCFFAESASRPYTECAAASMPREKTEAVCATFREYSMALPFSSSA